MTKQIKDLSYEEARDELQAVVSQLEQQNISLGDSMKLWERGEALSKVCEEFLAGARQKLTKAQQESSE